MLKPCTRSCFLALLLSSLLYACGSETAEVACSDKYKSEEVMQGLYPVADNFSKNDSNLYNVIKKHLWRVTRDTSTMQVQLENVNSNATYFKLTGMKNSEDINLLNCAIFKDPDFQNQKNVLLIYAFQKKDPTDVDQVLISAKTPAAKN